MRRPIDVHRCRDGLLSERMAVLHHEVFGEAVDREAWMKRMFPGQSWVLSTPHGFLVAHRRHDGASGPVVNIWLAGIAPTARGTGEFRALVHSLLHEVGLSAQLTMTTRPLKFAKMFAILTMVARRCDSPEDAAVGKARFRVPAWVVWMALHRRAGAGLLLFVAVAGVACAWVDRLFSGSARLR